MRVLLAVLLLACALTFTSCGGPRPTMQTDPQHAAYDFEPSWSDSQKLIPLTYEQAQGKRLFYQYCVWCHADSTPAGPSNRSNLSPTPALANDGKVLNALTEEQLRNTIALGGSAVGKSAMMPRWDGTLTPKEIQSLSAFLRAIAEPPYSPPARPGPRYSVR